MSESNQPVVIDHEPTQSNRQEKKSNYIKDSASRIFNIAETYGLDALLQPETPEKNTLERALIRERKRKELRQKKSRTNS